MKRREFLKLTAVVSGSLLIGVQWSCASDNMTESDQRLNAWVQIQADNQITFIIDRAEMGQGVLTALTMLLAEELEIEPKQVKTEFAPVADVYKNPALHSQVTGGSTSIAMAWQPLREAGAKARELLLLAAAKTWQIEKSQCYVKDTKVWRKDNQQFLTYGELVDVARQLSPPKKVRLKPASQYRFIGKAIPRLETADKVEGNAEFGIDVSLPDLLVAVVIHPPVFGSQVESFDASKAKQKAGVVDIIEIPQGIAVVAQSYWQAEQASQLLEIQWKTVDLDSLDSTIIQQNQAELVKQTGRLIHQQGQTAQALIDKADARQTLSVTYQTPYLAHATMEPINCTAWVTEHQCSIWVPSQAPEWNKSTAKEITGLSEEQITVHTTFLGGGFGRRVCPDEIAEAVTISKRLKKPIKVLWPREQDIQHDYYRPATYHQLKASFDANKQQVKAWQHKFVCPSILSWMLPHLVQSESPSWLPETIKDLSGKIAHGVFTKWLVDDTSVEGTNIPYAIPNQTVEYIYYDPGIPVGFWRSVGHSQNAFVVEGFIDEIANQLNQDSYLFRRKLLQDHGQALAVLDRVAEMSQWHQNSNHPSRFLGIAQHYSFGSYVAQVAEVSIHQQSIQVEKVYCVIDCGQVVNPAIVKAQMQSAIVFGLTAALTGEITIEQGRVTQHHFDDYQLLRINQMPEVMVDIIPSENAPSGVGEPATPPIAPAVANAVYQATKQRLRSLPLRLT